MKIIRFVLLFLCSANGLSNCPNLFAQIPDTAWCNRTLDRAWALRDDKPDSMKVLLEAVIQRSSQSAWLLEASTAWNALGIWADDRESYDSALIFYQKALDLRRGFRRPDLLTGTLGNIGAVFESVGKPDSALLSYAEMLRVATEANDPYLQGKSHYIMGMALEAEGAYTEAHDHANKARYFAETTGRKDLLAKVYTLLGHIRFETEQYQMAQAWYRQALNLHRVQGDPIRIAESLSDLANAYDEGGAPDSAVACYLQAESIYKNQNDEEGLSQVYNNLGDAYKHLKSFDKALFYMQRSEKIREANREPADMIEIWNSLGDVHYLQGNLQKALVFTRKYFAMAETTGDQKYIQKGLKDFSKIYSALGDYKTAFDFRVRYDELRYKRLDESRARDFERRDVLFSDRQKQDELDRQKTELALRDAQLARSRAQAFGFLGGTLALLGLAGWLISRNRLKQRANDLLEKKNAAIAAEKQRADNLLHNILPEKTAAELMAFDRVQPVRYASVTVLFTDFKNFTTLAENLTPEALVAELDACFQAFDRIVQAHGLEKIKTIGDAYMCAGGLPEVNTTHAADAVSAAVEMQAWLAVEKADKMRLGLPFFDMRIGIHSGPVVAGVVGSKKFAYDIWGDTVNTAARMEQHSEPGKINLSESTFQLVKDRFLCTFRGRIAAKNKGEIDMYFVAGPASSTL